MRIRAHLLVLVLAVLLPVLVLAIILTARFWELQRQAYEQTFLERVRALRLALDTELTSTIQTLTALAESSANEDPPFAALRPQLESFVASDSGWVTMGIVMPDGTPALSLYRKGSANLAPDAETLATVRANRVAAISNLVASTNPPAWTTYIAVPAMRDGAIHHILYIGVNDQAWLAFLRTYPIAQRATLTLNDRNALLIARTLNHEKWVGKASGPTFWSRVTQKPEDSFRNVGLEGQSFYSAFSRSPVSGWVMGTGVPQEDVEAVLRGSLLLTLGGILGTFVLATLFAILVGRHITREIDYLSVRAKAIGDWQPAMPRRALTIEEAATVLASLDASGRQLHERQVSLNEALTNEAHARALAERANEAKDQFLAMLGHELRNPLSAIGSASALQRHTQDPSLLARSREIIERQVRHLTGIVNGLLDVARIASGKVVLTRSAVDLAAIARYCIHAIEDSGRAKHVHISIDARPVVVWGDETRLAQVVTNLVENAVKYTPPGGHVDVRVESRDDWAILTVRDDGMGIPAELMPRIFDLFAQGERTLDRAQGGVGLGLTVVRSLVEQHGGFVQAASEGAGKGSTLVVRLPRMNDAVATEAQPAPSTTMPRRIVIVDDNADARQALVAQLQSAGHDVHGAHDGPSAVEAIRDIAPDIAIVDIGLPGFDGLEVARRVRAEPKLEGVILIALSGYGSPQDRVPALDAGFSDYWVKPFEENALARVLAAAPVRTEQPSLATPDSGQD
jgi:signal transduction histidine kinase/CheY-like chemotaxis protein